MKRIKGLGTVKSLIIGTLGFMFVWLVCTSGIMFLCNHFLFGRPIDDHTALISLVEGLCIGGGRMICWGVKDLVDKFGKRR